MRLLRDRLAARPTLDPSPVPLEGTPAELRPFLDEINSLLHRLAEAVEAQSRFVADAAHQLRTPIAGIRAQAEAGNDVHIRSIIRTGYHLLLENAVTQEEKDRFQKELNQLKDQM